MKTNRLTRGKVILSIMLAMVLAGGFYFLGGDSFAAAGTVTINVANQGEWPENTKFKFNLYKVGEYSHDSSGNAIFVLDGKYSDAGVDTILSDAANYGKPDTEAAEKEWTQKWLDTANTLSTYINGMTSGKPESLGEKTAEFDAEGDATFSYSPESSGLYLLVGTPAEIGDKLWTPQPMFISMLNKDKTVSFNNTYGVKMISRNIVYNHNLIKMWEGDSGIESLVRPDKIAVRIMYGSTEVAAEVLDKANDYQHFWKHVVHYDTGKDAGTEDDDTIASIDYVVTDAQGKEIRRKNFVPAAGDAGWSVIELRDPASITDPDAKAQAPLLRYYTTEYTINEIDTENESFVITNTFTCKYLKLRKTIDGYDDDGHNVTFSFKITGKDGAGSVIYTNHVGVTFTKEDGLTKETVINYIPGDVASIEVEEEYSGNYELDGAIEISELMETAASDEAQADASEDAQPAAEEKVVGWEASVNNKHGEHGPKGGIVNRYNHGEKPAADPGREPEAETPAPAVTTDESSR